MKTTLLVCALTLAVSFGFSANSRAQSTGSFIISNQQSVDAGMVTITATNGTYFGTVPGNRSDTVLMSSDSVATSVMIDGQTVPVGIKAIVTLSTGKQVAVLWPAQNTIVIMDERDLGYYDDYSQYNYDRVVLA